MESDARCMLTLVILVLLSANFSRNSLCQLQGGLIFSTPSSHYIPHHNYRIYIFPSSAFTSYSFTHQLIARFYIKSMIILGNRKWQFNITMAFPTKPPKWEINNKIKHPIINFFHLRIENDKRQNKLQRQAEI